MAEAGVSDIPRRQRRNGECDKSQQRDPRDPAGLPARECLQAPIGRFFQRKPCGSL
jgi:hypothetical protein